jgi:hypothetical protein
VRRFRLVGGLVGVVACATLGLLLFSGGRHDARWHGPVVDIVERDFAIVAPTNAPAGDVLFRLRNDGPGDHELIIIRAGGELPGRADGITLDEDAMERRTIGALEPGEPGTTRELRVHLVPGRYELFCNMSGHFLGGMHTIVTVA